MIFSLIELCAILRPRFMVLECVWGFFAGTQWLEPTIRAFQELGYGVFVRHEEANRYLPQDRERGLFTAVRRDCWAQASARREGLFRDPAPGRHATIASTGMVGPDPEPGSGFYLTPGQVGLYSPWVHKWGSWPWLDYRRVPGPGDQCPTIMRSYGTALRYHGSSGGVHGFLHWAPNLGYRHFMPAELAVAQGFPAGMVWPANRVTVWQLLGNAIPPPMALVGLLGPAAILLDVGQQGDQRVAQWAEGQFYQVLARSMNPWVGRPGTRQLGKASGPLPLGGPPWGGGPGERKPPPRSVILARQAGREPAPLVKGPPAHRTTPGGVEPGPEEARPPRNSRECGPGAKGCAAPRAPVGSVLVGPAAGQWRQGVPGGSIGGNAPQPPPPRVVGPAVAAGPQAPCPKGGTPPLRLGVSFESQYAEACARAQGSGQGAPPGGRVGAGQGGALVDQAGSIAPWQPDERFFPFPGTVPVPAHPSPTVYIRDGRRIRAGDGIPDEIWVDPPNVREVRVLMGLLPALRDGALDPLLVPGVVDGTVVRVRGVHIPGRPATGTPPPDPPFPDPGRGHPSPPRQPGTGPGAVQEPELGWHPQAGLAGGGRGRYSRRLR